MTDQRARRAILAGVALWVSMFGVAREAAGRVELDKRYVDPMHGFSLRPPAGTERRREFSAAKLVSWALRDEKSGAVVWTLTVLQAVEGKPVTDLKPYAEALADKLRTEENFHMEKDFVLGPVAGKAAIDLRGLTGGVQMWQRQVWVLAEPKRFLIVMISGSETMKAELDDVCSRVLATLQLSDPEEARQRQRKSIQRGQDFLAALNDAQFSAALEPGPTWFLLRMKDKDVGFRRVVEAPARVEGASGYKVTMWVLLDLPGLDVRLMKHEMFVTPDQTVETWSKRVQIGGDKSARVIDETALKQQDLLVCNSLEDRQTQTRKKKVPDKIYLPQATGMTLPRLIDLKTPEAYAFAAYNSEQNDFDMRTFTVLGKETISFGGRNVEAIRATDQAAIDAEPATLLLDEKGRLLRMEADGLEMERSTEQAVLRRFPKAAAIVKELGE